MLHSNELFLRHLIGGIDGPTSCNTGFLGPGGKFLPDILREIQCGSLSHARWLTTGMRIVFMWTRKYNLSNKNLENLELLVLFCLQFYFKHFFDIKIKDKLENASYHILSQLRILRNQPGRVKEIVTP